MFLGNLLLLYSWDTNYECSTMLKASTNPFQHKAKLMWRPRHIPTEHGQH